MQHDKASFYMHKIESSGVQHGVKQISLITRMIAIICSKTKQVPVCNPLIAVVCSKL